MSAIILMDADSEDGIHILEDEECRGFNKVFASVDDADLWLQKNAKCGWCTRIIDMDN